MRRLPTLSKLDSFSWFPSVVYLLTIVRQRAYVSLADGVHIRQTHHHPWRTQGPFSGRPPRGSYLISSVHERVFGVLKSKTIPPCSLTMRILSRSNCRS